MPTTHKKYAARTAEISVSVKRLAFGRVIALDGGWGIIISCGRPPLVLDVPLTNPGSIVIAIVATLIFVVIVVVIIVIVIIAFVVIVVVIIVIVVMIVVIIVIVIAARVTNAGSRRASDAGSGRC